MGNLRAIGVSATGAFCVALVMACGGGTTNQSTGGQAGSAGRGNGGNSPGSGGASGGVGGGGVSGGRSNGGVSNGGVSNGGVGTGGTSNGGFSNGAGGVSNGGTPASGGASGGVSSAGASSGGKGSGAGGAASSLCPSQPPAKGSSCTLVDPNAGSLAAHCSWGDDPRPTCRVTAICSKGSWSVTQPPANCATIPPLPAACPATPNAATGPCSDASLACWYENGTICECSMCAGGREYPLCQLIDPPEWACKAPEATCPVPMPLAGAPCDAPATLSCGPSCELPIRCQNGAWQYGQEMCPICAAPDTPIATPQGERAIAELSPGDLVYSVDETGVVVVPILRVGSVAVVNHHVVRVELAGGTVLEISPGHPTADGRTFADLFDGGQLDRDHVIVTAKVVPYAYARTYDILPKSSSGTYFAGGALIGSTLRSSRR